MQGTQACANMPENGIVTNSYSMYVYPGLYYNWDYITLIHFGLIFMFLKYLLM